MRTALQCDRHRSSYRAGGGRVQRAWPRRRPETARLRNLGIPRGQGLLVLIRIGVPCAAGEERAPGNGLGNSPGSSDSFSSRGCGRPQGCRSSRRPQQKSLSEAVRSESFKRAVSEVMVPAAPACGAGERNPYSQGVNEAGVASRASEEHSRKADARGQAHTGAAPADRPEPLPAVGRWATAPGERSCQRQPQRSQSQRSQ